MDQEPTIYIVDDDAAVQDSLRALLESANLKVETYGSGPAFLATLDKGRRGCVVLDIDLPDMDGLEVLDRLASLDVALPVILITGRYDQAARARTRKADALAVLEKPMRDGILLEMIGRALAGEVSPQTPRDDCSTGALNGWDS